MNTILSIFPNYTTAYLDYKNHAWTKDGYQDFYDFSDEEMDRLFNARKLCHDEQPFRMIDLYYNTLLCLDNYKNYQGEKPAYLVYEGCIKTTQQWVSLFLKQCEWTVVNDNIVYTCSLK